jgi:hypothetical protein
MWNERGMRKLMVWTLAAMVVAGCGGTEANMPDKSADAGIAKRQIDRAKDVAAKENAYNREGESAAEGGGQN